MKSQPADVPPQAVRATHLSEPLQTMRTGWNCINDGLYAIFTKSRCFVDSAVAPSNALMWLRTALIKVGGRWQVLEFAADVGQLSDLECNILIPGVTDVLT